MPALKSTQTTVLTLTHALSLAAAILLIISTVLLLITVTLDASKIILACYVIFFCLCICLVDCVNFLGLIGVKLCGLCGEKEKPRTPPNVIPPGFDAEWGGPVEEHHLPPEMFTLPPPQTSLIPKNPNPIKDNFGLLYNPYLRSFYFLLLGLISITFGNILSFIGSILFFVSSGGELLISIAVDAVDCWNERGNCCRRR